MIPRANPRRCSAPPMKEDLGKKVCRRCAPPFNRGVGINRDLWKKARRRCAPPFNRGVGIKHPTGCAIPQRRKAHLGCRDRTTAGCLISGERESEERHPRLRKSVSDRTAALRKQSAAPAGAFHMTGASSRSPQPEIKGPAVAWSRRLGFHHLSGVTTQPPGPLIPTTYKRTPMRFRQTVCRSAPRPSRKIARRRSASPFNKDVGINRALGKKACRCCAPPFNRVLGIKHPTGRAIPQRCTLKPDCRDRTTGGMFDLR